MTIPGNNTRPTTDRVKETLFNILQPELPGCRFLDLFAGSGAIGIEALSRGADSAVFVENNRRAAACIKENLRFTKLADQATLVESDVIAAIARLERANQAFDIIFLDPPYQAGWEEKVLRALKTSCLADEGTWVVTEAELHEDFSWAEEMGYSITRIKEYKNNKHVFFQKAPLHKGDKEGNA